MAEGRTLKQFLPLFLATNTHGINGEVKCQKLCDRNTALSHIKTVFLDKQGTKALDIQSVRGSDDISIVKFSQYGTPEEAQYLKTKILYAKREDIPLQKGSYFIADLIGLPVFDADSKKILGKVNDVIDNPANQLYEISTGKQKVLFPVVKEYIEKVDLESGIYLHIIPGFFDDSEEQ